MGMMDKLLGNAGEISVEEAQQEFRLLLTQGEQVQKAYQLIRDSFVFTDRRMILVDRQGVTGKKIAYRSIPYRRISHFTIETAGTFDRDAELVIAVSGGGTVQKQFNKKLDVYELQRVLAHFVLS